MRVPDQYRDEHSACYGMGCFVCEGRGWFESEEGREAREEAEERRYEERREERWT